MKNLLIYILILATALFFACKEKSQDDSKHESHHHETEHEPESEHEELSEDIVEMDVDQIKLAGIQLTKIQSREIGEVISANGKVITMPEQMVTLSASMGGYLKSCNLLSGAFVKKGQVLAQIENVEFISLQQNYLETKSKFAVIEEDFKRHQELYKNDVYSEKNIQQVQSDYKSTKVQLHALEQKLVLIGINPNHLTEDQINASVPLIAPISGFLKTSQLSIGKYFAPGEVLFEIVNTDHMLLELKIFEKDINKIIEGQEVEFTINNEVHTHKAKVYQTAKSVNSENTFTVYAKIDQECKNVLPGMYVQAKIGSQFKNSISVPDQAIVNFDNKYFIFSHERDKTENGKPFVEYRFIEVKKGNSTAGFTEIELPLGSDISKLKIVSKGAYKLLSAKKNAGEMTCG